MTSNDGGYYPPPGFPGHPGYPHQPPPKSRSRWPWIIGGGAVVVVLAVVAAVAFFTLGSGGEDDRYDSHRTVVTYEVTGAAASVEIIYESPEGQQHLDATPLPWGETVTLVGEDAYFEVSARAAGESDGELACRVITYGATRLEDRTRGGFVSCGGRVNEL